MTKYFPVRAESDFCIHLIDGENAKSPNSSNRNVMSAPLIGAPNFEKLKISNNSAICWSFNPSQHEIAANTMNGNTNSAISFFSSFRDDCSSGEVPFGDMKVSCLLWEDMVVTRIRQAGSLKPQVKVGELRVGQAEILPPHRVSDGAHKQILYI